MKRCFACFIAFCLLTAGGLFPACACADGPEGPPDGEKYPVISPYLLEVFEPQTLLSAADEAMSDGADPQQALEEAFALAEEYGVADRLEYAIGNISAFENETYQKIESYFADLDVNYTNYYLWGGQYDDFVFSESGTSPYDAPFISEEFAALLADESAQYCLRPRIWPEEGFAEVFGTAYAGFRPASARPGYACVIAKNGAKAGPTEAWNEENGYDFTESLNQLLTDICTYLGEDAPVFTANPQLASEFWVYDIQYPFYALYGSTGDVKGYNCTATLTVLDAATKQNIATLSGTERLGDTIWSWHDGISLAEPPVLSESAGFTDFAGFVRHWLQKNRSEAASERKITGYNAGSVLNAILLAESSSLYDNWQKAIFEGGAENVALSDGTLSFSVRSFDPDISSLGAYAEAEDKRAWLMAALENAFAYDMEMTLQLQDGRPDYMSMNTMKNTAQQAAYRAQQAFNSADLQTALKEYLFRAPSGGEAATGGASSGPGKEFISFAESSGALQEYSAEVWAPLFFGQVKQSVSVSGGPHAMTLSYVGISPAELLSQAYTAALDSQAYVPGEERTEDLPALFAEKLAETSEELTKTVYYDAKNSRSAEIDLEKILRGEVPAGYREYLASYQYAEYADRLSEVFDMLPGQAASEIPPSTKMTGPGYGIAVCLQVAAGGENTYIQVCGAESGELVSSAFVHPGHTVAVFVPAGEYYLVYGSGPYWYGPEPDGLFGRLGSYTKSEIFDISTGVTFVLEPSEDGDVGIYGADPGDFLTNPVG